ncbi:MAG: cytochrome c maturation protein CcmE [Candidatus Kapabacteria bacterium]|nr:cytochrome c maturation protein CcmE [Ignavibacteriota bacterium]MCW5885580.1 cytochrome c maturation protein CcmE [Candidatus Kapabacteria bacterium]
MNKKYIIGSVIGVVFVVVAYLSFDSSKIEYTDFEHAKESGKIVQVVGSWNKSENYHYDSDKNEFIFLMNDENGNSSHVRVEGAKPNNFDVAPMVVIKGKFEGDKFHAKEVLTKCPSKYEGQFDELKGASLYN